MKRIYVALALLVAIAALTVYSNLRVKKELTAMDSALIQAAAFCQQKDYEQALTHIEEYHTIADEAEGFFTLFVRQDFFYALKESAATLMEYNNEETNKDMLAELERARERLEIIDHAWFRLY